MPALVNLSSDVRIAAALGLCGSAWCSGALMCFTFGGGSALLDPSLPAAAAAQASLLWRQLYLRRKAKIPPVGVCTALAFAYAAYKLRKPHALKAIQRTRKTLALAALLTVSIVPYTLIIMKHTNAALLAKSTMAEERSKKGLETILDAGTKELIKKWNALNLGRGTLPLLATGLALYAFFFDEQTPELL
ncbi:hypothetical protein BDP27DRAFT_1367183 [Rhodocollybia butyracea]|uniref:Uncharacterized protein n=1 Tax=Rhodocollybia butyracea TaxID=206335 RepID=A0A9P5U469_9AGAR|nr:hypothetical protein BDP27DRAFT_1367183 [Rhodocollybia butyracea]